MKVYYSGKPTGSPANSKETLSAYRVLVSNDEHEVTVQTVLRHRGAVVLLSERKFNVFELIQQRAPEYFQKYFVQLEEGKLTNLLVWNDTFSNNVEQIGIITYQRRTGFYFPVYLAIHHKARHEFARQRPVGTVHDVAPELQPAGWDDYLRLLEIRCPGMDLEVEGNVQLVEGPIGAL